MNVGAREDTPRGLPDAFPVLSDCDPRGDGGERNLVAEWDLLSGFDLKGCIRAFHRDIFAGGDIRQGGGDVVLLMQEKGAGHGPSSLSGGGEIRLGQPKPQPFDDPSVFQMLFHEFRHVFLFHPRVPDPFGVDDDGGPHHARAEAGGPGDGGGCGKLAHAHRFVQCLDDLDASFGLTASLGMILGALINANEQMALYMFHGSPIRHEGSEPDCSGRSRPVEICPAGRARVKGEEAGRYPGD